MYIHYRDSPPDAAPCNYYNIYLEIVNGGGKIQMKKRAKKGYYKETFITSQTLKVLPLEPKSIKKNERLYVKEANGKLKRK